MKSELVYGSNLWQVAEVVDSEEEVALGPE